MIFIEIIQYSLATVTVVLLSYHLILSIFALNKKKRIDFNSERKRRFAIVVPAPGNEQTIPKLLYSLFGLVYPKTLYDVIVIGNNISDDTADNAREMGAVVLRQKGLGRGKKSYEMQWAFEKILQGDKIYDAILVIESNSLVSGNYLDVMNYYLENESRVIQSNNLILPRSGLQGNERKRFWFLLYNLVKPLDRKILGFNMGLGGNGICFTAQIIRENPWITNTLTRNTGFGLELQLRNIHMDFAHEATLLKDASVEPKRSDLGEKHRKSGRLPIIRRYGSKLLKAAFQQKSLTHFKSLVDLLTPSLIYLLIITVIMGGISLTMWEVVSWPLTFVWIWVFLAFFDVIDIAVGLYAINKYHQSYKSMI